MRALIRDTPRSVRSLRKTSPTAPAQGSAAFWSVDLRRRGASKSHEQYRQAFSGLIDRISDSSGLLLFDAVEAGVPTQIVELIAGATGETTSRIMAFIGVSATTFRRKEEAREPLPDIAGHRLMAFLRVVATLRKLLDESGDPEQVKQFDLESWVARWMREELAELGGKTPAEMLRNPEGQRAVEQVLERMRGGLPA